ncbi:hypothetical protein [Thalassobacillus devorans]|nr:hypothetical protein [Thalassobacillus devorans]
MIKRMVKFWSPYVLGVFIVVTVMGLTQDGKADWGGLVEQVSLV